MRYPPFPNRPRFVASGSSQANHRSFQQLGLDPAFDAADNWVHYDLPQMLDMAAKGVDVWPMVHPGVTKSLHKLQVWRDRGNIVTHLEVGREPKHMRQPAAAAAKWTKDIVFQAFYDGLITKQTTLLVGAFLIEHQKPGHGSWHEIKAYSDEFYDGISVLFDNWTCLRAMDIYWHVVPQSVPEALDWWEDQARLSGAQAITETGIRPGASGYGRREWDIGQLSAYFKGIIERAKALGLYSVNWYTALPVNEGSPDIMLTTRNGSLTPLGESAKQVLEEAAEYPGPPVIPPVDPPDPTGDGDWEDVSVFSAAYEYKLMRRKRA